MLANGSVEVCCGGIGDGGDLEAGDFRDGIAKLGIGDSERDLLLVFDRFQYVGKCRRDL